MENVGSRRSVGASAGAPNRAPSPSNQESDTSHVAEVSLCLSAEAIGTPQHCALRYYEWGSFPTYRGAVYFGDLTNLVKLKLGHHVTELPLAITRHTNLQDLDVAGNSLSTLPPEIAQLENLKECNLSFNELRELPDEFTHLTKLWKLDLHFNKRLSKLPGRFTNLTNLEHLDLGHNQLVTLPDEMGKLVNLQWLDLSFNQLTGLPPSFANLVNLRWLTLEKNQLTESPSELFSLTALKELNLSRNPLTRLSSRLSELVNLGKLMLNETPLVVPPMFAANLPNLELGLPAYGIDSIVKKGNKAIERAQKSIQSDRAIDFEGCGEFFKKWSDEVYNFDTLLNSPKLGEGERRAYFFWLCSLGKKVCNLSEQMRCVVGESLIERIGGREVKSAVKVVVSGQP